MPRVDVYKRQAEYQRTNPKRQLAQARKARGQYRIDPGGGGVDDQPARGDRELHGEVFVGDEYGVIGEQQAAVHQDDDKERVVEGERRGAPGRGSAPHDGRGRDDHERTGSIG